MISRAQVQVAVGLALALAGCARFDTGAVARSTAARLLECPERNVELHPVGEYRFRAEGCGRSVALACTASELEPECLRESEIASAGGEAPAPEEEAEHVATSEPDTDVEARIRAGLDARSEDVLACVGRDRVAVRVGYAPDGSVDVALQGALHGSPEERCVQDALDGVRVPATGGSGVVVHLVHAAQPAARPSAD